MFPTIGIYRLNMNETRVPVVDTSDSFEGEPLVVEAIAGEQSVYVPPA